MTTALALALDEVHTLLAGDGLRFELVDNDPPAHAVTLRLNLDDVACSDCIMPVDYLTSLVQDTLQEVLGDRELALTIDDPRVARQGA